MIRSRFMPVNAASPANDTTASVQELAARRLRDARVSAGLTVEQAASVLGCAPTTVWRREEGLVDLGPACQLVVLEQMAANRKAA